MLFAARLHWLWLWDSACVSRPARGHYLAKTTMELIKLPWK
jgi:hypothetical protein